MTRAKTKLDERVELRNADDRTLGEWSAKEWAENHKRHRAKADVDAGERFVRVHRYRLAPLVELPAWRPSNEYPDTEQWSEHEGAVYAAFYVHDGVHIALVCPEGHEESRTEHATADEARAACEERLRELGYKVAKPKAPKWDDGKSPITREDLEHAEEQRRRAEAAPRTLFVSPEAEATIKAATVAGEEDDPLEGLSYRDAHGIER